MTLPPAAYSDPGFAEFLRTDAAAVSVAAALATALVRRVVPALRAGASCSAPRGRLGRAEAAGVGQIGLTAAQQAGAGAAAA